MEGERETEEQRLRRQLQEAEAAYRNAGPESRRALKRQWQAALARFAEHVLRPTRERTPDEL